jgi:hypothetical protein
MRSLKEAILNANPTAKKAAITGHESALLLPMSSLKRARDGILNEFHPSGATSREVTRITSFELRTARQ